ncbi:DMT family transporter [Nocardioides sp.]|uniref:DMT family transporter n=1 Tax=Nocardioides sp. TaxID=35761 RepID=UPI002ED8B383
MTTTRRLGILLALGTAMVSGVSVWVNASGVREFTDATAYTTAKNLVAAVVLAVALGVVGVARGRLGAAPTLPHGPGAWLGLLAVGVLGGGVAFVLFFEGLARATSTQAALLHKTLVLWVALLAVALLRERLQWGHWVAIGALLVAQVGIAGGVPGSLGRPELLILGATALWSLEVVIAKRLLASVSSWTLGVARMTIGSIALLSWLAVRGRLDLLGSLTGEQVGWVLLTGLLLAAYVATWFAALARAQAVDVTAVLVLAVPVTAVLQAVVDGAALAPQAGWQLLLVGAVGLVCWLGVRPRAELARADA